MKNKITVKLILGLVVILIVVAIFFNSQISSMPEKSKEPELPSLEGVTFDSVEEDNTQIDLPGLPPVPEGWKRYVNQELGFSINYPEEWFVKDYQKNNPPGKLLIIGFDPWSSNPAGSVWRVIRQDAIGTIEERLDEISSKQNVEGSITTRTKILSDGHPTVKIVSEHTDENLTVYSLVIPLEKYTYTISATDYRNIDTQIDTSMLGEYAVAYPKRLALLKELSLQGYPEIFLQSFHVIE